MSIFQISLALNIIGLLIVLYWIFYKDMFELWRFERAMAAFMLIVAFVAIGLGESQKWFWLPAIWILGTLIPHIARFVIKKLIPSFKEPWNGYWP